MMFISILLLFVCQEVRNVEIDPSKTIIWGPGLKPDKITMRARYIFLQFVDTEGKKYIFHFIMYKIINTSHYKFFIYLKIIFYVFSLTESPGKDVISVSTQGQTSTGHLCHIWTQILDCKDGNFIVRYKLHSTCFDLKLKIELKQHNLPLLSLKVEGIVKFGIYHSYYFHKVIKDSYKILGPTYEEECYCPNADINHWLDNFECAKNYTQIHNDLAGFTNVDFDKIREDIVKAYDRPGSVSLCRYVVKSNKVSTTVLSSKLYLN